MQKHFETDQKDQNISHFDACKKLLSAAEGRRMKLNERLNMFFMVQGGPSLGCRELSTCPEESQRSNTRGPARLRVGGGCFGRHSVQHHAAGPGLQHLATAWCGLGRGAGLLLERPCGLPGVSAVVLEALCHDQGEAARTGTPFRLEYVGFAALRNSQTAVSVN